MGLVALLSDTHWGVRGDNPIFLNNNKKFVEKLFIPTLRERGIKTVIHLGDLVDCRKYLNTQVASRLRRDFIDPITKEFDFHWIIGNHDTFRNESNDISAAREYYPYLQFYDEAVDVNIEGRDILFVPWISNQSRERSYETIKKSKSRVVMGHLELRNFEMHYAGGQVNENGDNPERYYKFDRVFTGHFHHKSQRDNVYYLGAHGEFTWNDYDDPRGFHLFDTDTYDLSYVPNPYHMFNVIHYFQGMDVPDVEDQYVKVLVKTGYVPQEVEMFLNKLYERKPFELKVEYENEGFISDIELFDMDGRNALDLMMNEINDTEASINKIKTLEIARKIYQKAADQFHENTV